MSDFVGVGILENPIHCLKEVSGKTFESRIAGHNVSIVFPSIPDNYNVDEIHFPKGDLVVPKNMFDEKVMWGRVEAWPAGLFSVHAFLCYTDGTASDVKEIYEAFPRWKEKLNNLLLIDMGNYLQPKQKMPAIIQGGGLDDGLQFFEIINEKEFRYIKNSRKMEPISIHFTESKECYSAERLKKVFLNVGNDKEISLAYELLITAYRAMERHDFRSAVVLGGTAVEQAALKRLRKEYSSNKKFKRDKGKTKNSTLGGRFRWLSEKSIDIPVSDYKGKIVDVRNDATHEGMCPSYNDTKICLENCKILVETYNPSRLEL